MSSLELSPTLPCLLHQILGWRTRARGTSESNEISELRGAPGDLQGCLGDDGSAHTPPSTSMGPILDLFCLFSPV